MFTIEASAKLLKTISVGALPHGIWASGDGSRIYVGLENGDAVDVIDTTKNEIVARIPVGQAPQALVFVPEASDGGDSRANLSPRPASPENVNIALKPVQGADGSGFVVSRNLGLIDIFEITVSNLKPETVYRIFLEGHGEPVAVLKTNPKGMGNVSAVGPTRQVRPLTVGETSTGTKVLVVEGEAAPTHATPVLTGG